MTNKEAIAILIHNWKYRELIDNSYQYEALTLAIEALEKNETYKNAGYDKGVHDERERILHGLKVYIDAVESEDS